ncbi:MAG: NAD(P)-dependent oxidoreductase [Geminicoccaceae bacterium]
MRIGMIGCGNMGGGMAAHLVDNGQEVHCFDPNPEVLKSLEALGALKAASASDLAARCDLIILSLPNAAVVRGVMAEITPHLRDGSVVLDTSTSEPETSKEMAALGTAKGFAFVDGPVSGGPSAARLGTMTMLLGGDRDVIKRLQPVTDLLTAMTVVVGGAGAGHAAKIVNNMLCAANLVLVAEAVRLGEAAGVEARDLLEGVNAGSGRSGVSEVNFPKWILNGAFDSGFTMGLMRKDVSLAQKLAEESGVALNGFEAIAHIWLEGSRAIPDTADFNEITKYGNGGKGE